MASLSSKCNIPIFHGEDFEGWSKKMKMALCAEGFWLVVEKGYRSPIDIETLSSDEMNEFKADLLKDSNAISLIRQSLSPLISIRVVDIKTSKECWDALHAMFHSPSKMMNEDEVLPVRDEAIQLISGEDEVMPLSGEYPFFDMALTKSAVKPQCHLNFSWGVGSLFPSSNIVAKVRTHGKEYEIFFYGDRKQKSFGSGWRQIVIEQKLEEGDFVVFEILESSESRLEMNLQVLRSRFPPQLQMRIN